MPAKLKPRSPSGITNRSSSTLSLAGSHGPQCVCKTCTCGNHHCAEKKKAGTVTQNQPLEGASETKQQFIPREIPSRKDFKPPVQLPEKRDLQSETENHSAYVPKPVPPRPQPHIEKYVKNPAIMDGKSETSEKYGVHEVHKRIDYKPVPQLPPKLDIETTTEIRQQFVPKPVPPRPQRRVIPYVKNEALLAVSTETKETYIAKEIPERHMFKPPVQLPPKRDIEVETETTRQFVPKPVPPPPKPHIAKYEKNPNLLEGDSETHQAYKQWPNQGVPHKFKAVEMKKSSQTLDGESVTRTDYKETIGTSRVALIKRPNEYHPPTGDLAKVSLYNDEFVPHTDVHPPKKHEREVLQRGKEDREFTTVTGTSYLPVNPSDIHVPVKHREPYRPSGLNLEGESVLRSDYGSHDLSTLERKDLKKAALVDRQGTVRIAASDSNEISIVTEYSQRYIPTGELARTQPIKPPTNTTIAGKNVNLEGESELHHSYQHPAVVSGLGDRVFERPANFKPPYVRATGDEDRDFSTQTNSSFVPEKATCPVISKIGKAKKVGEDGHVYFVGTTENLFAI